MRPQIEDVLLPVRRMYFERQLGSRLRQRFPRQPGDTRFVRNRPPRRYSQRNGGGLQALSRAQDPLPLFRSRRDGQMNGLPSFFGERERTSEQFLFVDRKQVF